MTRTNPIAVMQKRYNDFAPAYVATWSHLEGYSHLVADFLGRTVRPGMRVLDVGCGPGHLTAGLPASVQVVGLDVSPAMLAKAREARPAGIYVEHDYYRPVPPKLGLFDVVLGVGALDFCEDLELVLGHLADTARPGARLLINLIERRSGVRGHENCRLPISPEKMPGVDLIFYTLSEMADAVQLAGLWPLRYVHYKGYRNQYHELDIQYAMWELEQPAL